MSYDIYGEPLRRGHCEVHPHVQEEYPCSVCFAEKQAHDDEGRCRGGCESEHYLGQAQEYIKELEAQRDAEAARVTELEKDAARYRWLTHQAWFQSAFDRFDPDDGGIQERFESEADRIIDAAIAEGDES